MFGDVDSGSAKQELSILLIALNGWRQVIEKGQEKCPLLSESWGPRSRPEESSEANTAKLSLEFFPCFLPRMWPASAWIQTGVLGGPRKCVCSREYGLITVDLT